MYAYREANKLLSSVSGNPIEGASIQDMDELSRSIKRTILLLKPTVEAFSQNSASLDIARRIMKCDQK